MFLDVSFRLGKVNISVGLHIVGLHIVGLRLDIPLGYSVEG